jgi:hypothetical protein
MFKEPGARGKLTLHDVDQGGQFESCVILHYEA